MRYGVISDVHGNLAALNATLEVLHRQRIDKLICAGDLVGYGPHPNECVSVIAEHHPICVAGNHDLIACDRLTSERANRLARQTLEWTRDVLADDARTYLEQLPLTAQADGVVVAHGALDDPSDYTLTPEQGAAQLELMCARHCASFLILGHTHRAWALTRAAGVLPLRRNALIRFSSQDVMLLNPGSVGQSRELRALARFLILDLASGEASFYGISYDHRRCRRELIRNGLPSNACHRRPSLPRSLKRTAKKLLAS